MSGREVTDNTWKVATMAPEHADPHARDIKREALQFAVSAHRESDPDEIVKAAKRYEAFLKGDEDVVA